MATTIDKSFKATIKMMTFFGLYTPENSSLLFKVRACVIYITFLVLLNALLLVNILYWKNSEASVMNLMVLVTTATSAFCFQLSPFLINSDRIRKCINFFGNNRFAPRNDAEKEITDECVAICRRNTYIYFYGIIVSEISYCLPPLFSKDLRLPLEIWLPYDPKSSYLNYYLTFAYISAGLLYAGFAEGAIHPLIGGLAYHATCQLKILKYNLEHINQSDQGVQIESKNKLKQIKFVQVDKNLRRCVNHYNEILRFVAEYEDCFSFSVFCQFAGSLFGLCFCCIGLTLTPVTSDLGVIYLLTYIMIIFQILFYCHYGTLLFEENNTLIDAIYMGQWYKYDKTIKKILLIVMERSKRPMIVTAAKVIALTLQTYVWVLKSSYSLTTVMNNYG